MSNKATERPFKVVSKKWLRRDHYEKLINDRLDKKAKKDWLQYRKDK